MQGERTHRDVKANGVRVRLLESGDRGPWVVLLHDLFTDHTTWDAVVDELSRDFRVVALDFPGFGDSEKPPASRFAYDVDAFTEVVADLYAGLGIGPAALVGHGLGGAVALSLAGRHPELASRLVLVDTPCYEPAVDLRRRLALLPVVGGFIFRQLWGRPTFRAYFRAMNDRKRAPDKVDTYYDSFNDPASRGSALSTLRATIDTRPVSALAARVSVPTLVVWGRGDRLIPARHGQRLARQIRGAGFELMDAGHAPHEESPVAFASIVARFLRAERPRGT